MPMPVGLVVTNGSKISILGAGWQSGATVVHDDLDQSPAIAGLDGHHPLRHRTIGHGVHRVGHHIEKHLLQIDLVAGDDERTRAGLVRHGHVPEHGVAGNENGDVLHDRIGIERFR